MGRTFLLIGAVSAPTVASADCLGIAYARRNAVRHQHAHGDTTRQLIAIAMMVNAAAFAIT